MCIRDRDQSPCYLCARMRRGHLYHYAQELGCNKIALGHHYDDVIETILMGMLYGAQVQTMMPKLHSTNSVSYTHLYLVNKSLYGRNVTGRCLLRPERRSRRSVSKVIK